MREQGHTGRKDKPIIVFAGRSNVGKSSAIRTLTGRKLRVGKKPGSTRWEKAIDMGAVQVVDIPGFGFMSGQSKTTIDETKDRIVQNLERWAEKLILSVLIIDVSLFRELFDRWSARGEIPIDVEFYTFLSEISERVIVAANKVDKLKKREIPEELDFMAEKLRDATPGKTPDIIATSCTKRRGLKRLRNRINDILTEYDIETPDWALT
jgi:GTP-binding protein EngB required for normal cell division